jgi:ankyrin repeat protein
VFCQLVYLRGCIPGRIRRALDELPETLDETYARTLEEIDEQSWEYAHRLFQCVTAASRPLLVNELAEFLAFDFEAGSTPAFLADWRPEDPAYTVLSICPSFLAVVKPRHGSPVVQFAHFSVKEYLTSARLTKAKDVISRFHVSMTPAHTIVAQACLGVLLHLDENVTEDSLENFPLAKYAARHWMSHAWFENVSSSLQDGMKRLFDPSRSHLSVWVWICDPENPDNRSEKSRCPANLNPRATPLHYAAYCGMRDVAAFLIVEHSQDVNARRGFYENETPLHVASGRRHVDVAQLLLEHGADTKAVDSGKSTPLLRASQGGYVELARILLEHGADTEIRDFKKHTPLLLASKDGHVELSRTLLEHGADTEARNDRKYTPLLLAAEWGHVEVVRVLLEHGADTDARQERGSGALELPSLHGHVEVVRVLLEHGADVKGRGWLNQTPLHYAEGEEIARLFLKHGADANALDFMGQTPLHQASERGRVGAARVLLEHGVDVNARDANSATALHLASRPKYSIWGRGHPDVVRLLLQYNPDVRARDDKGQTPFMRAAEEGNHSIMLLLSEYGAEDHTDSATLRR